MVSLFPFVVIGFGLCWILSHQLRNTCGQALLRLKLSLVKDIEIQRLDYLLENNSNTESVKIRTTEARFSSCLKERQLDFEKHYFWFQKVVIAPPTTAADAPKWMTTNPAFSLSVEDLFHYCNAEDKLYAIPRSTYQLMRNALEEDASEGAVPTKLCFAENCNEEESSIRFPLVSSDQRREVILEKLVEIVEILASKVTELKNKI